MAQIKRRAAIDAERASRESQAQQRLSSLTERLRSLQSELRQNDTEIELMAQRVKLAEKGHARQVALAQSGFVSEAQVQSKLEDLVELQSRDRASARNRTALERDIKALQAEQGSSRTTWLTEQAQFDRQLALLAQESIENDSRKQVTIAAQKSGRLSALLVKPGQMVTLGQSLATLIPGCDPVVSTQSGVAGIESSCLGNTLLAQLYAPSRAAGFVSLGQAVLIRYAAYPYQKFGLHNGQVIAISATPLAPSDLPPGHASASSGALQNTEPLYRITVALTHQHITAFGKQLALKPGESLEADLLQERRPIWEWVFEPVLAARAQWGHANPLKAPA